MKREIKKQYLTIAEEDNLRLEFDYLVANNQTNAKHFANWLRHLGYRRDSVDGLWYRVEK